MAPLKPRRFEAGELTHLCQANHGPSKDKRGSASCVLPLIRNMGLHRWRVVGINDIGLLPLGSLGRIDGITQLL